MIFTLLGNLSYFGYRKMWAEYPEKVQQNPQDAIKCRVYFTHAFDSMVMGWLTLALKGVEGVLYLVVKAFQVVMLVFPWRQKVLDEKLKNGKIYVRVKFIAPNVYVGAGLIIIESIQTLIDLPILLLVIPIALLTPYRISYVKRDLTTLTPKEWRV